MTDADTRCQTLVAAFGTFEGPLTSEEAQREILTLGELAIPALMDALDGPRGWTAASCLGVLGIPRPDVIAALRLGADQMWFAKALGFLGDLAWLAEQGGQIAVHGLTAPLLAVGWRLAPPSVQRRTLDLAALESWLDRAPDEDRAGIDSALEPGRSYRDATERDLPALRAVVNGRHAVLRWTATSMLGGLGRGDEDLDHRVAANLGDDHPFVRRLAVLSVERRGVFPAHRDDIAAMRDDPDEIVARIATAIFDRNG